jgi:hypothetical protein
MMNTQNKSFANFQRRMPEVNHKEIDIGGGP